MKSFKEFIQESSLTSLKSKSDKGGMAVLSEVVEINLQKKIVQEQNN